MLERGFYWYKPFVECNTSKMFELTDWTLLWVNYDYWRKCNKATKFVDRIHYVEQVELVPDVFYELQKYGVFIKASPPFPPASI